MSHLCLMEPDVGLKVTAASNCHPTHPGSGGINKMGGAKSGESEAPSASPGLIRKNGAFAFMSGTLLL